LKPELAGYVSAELSFDTFIDTLLAMKSSVVSLEGNTNTPSRKRKSENSELLSALNDFNHSQISTRKASNTSSIDFFQE